MLDALVGVGCARRAFLLPLSLVNVSHHRNKSNPWLIVLF